LLIGTSFDLGLLANMGMMQWTLGADLVLLSLHLICDHDFVLVWSEMDGKWMVSLELGALLCN